jgi:hypothetical protein
LETFYGSFYSFYFTILPHGIESGWLAGWLAGALLQTFLRIKWTKERKKGRVDSLDQCLMPNYSFYLVKSSIWPSKLIQTGNPERKKEKVFPLFQSCL